MISRIDSLAGLDLSTISRENIRWQIATGVSLSSKRGRKQSNSYRFGVLTDLGDIEISQWRQLAETLVERQGEQWLVDALIEWGLAHNYTKSTLDEIRLDALKDYINGLYDRPEWVDYIPFNRQHRPQILDHARIVTVFHVCCGRPGEVTQEQIDRAWQGEIACPHCGRWSLFAPCLANGALPWEEVIGRQQRTI